MNRLAPIVFALLLIAPSSSAQDNALLSDTEGDVQIYPIDGQAGSPVPGGRMGEQDLVAGTVKEDRDTFTFTLQVASLGDGAPIVESSDLAVTFAHGERVYVVAFDLLYRIGQTGVEARAELKSFDGDRGGFAVVRDLDVAIDAAQATVSTVVQRSDLVDENGSKPYVGSKLTGFVATSSGFFAGPRASIAGQPVGMPLQTADRMPDTGPGPDLPVRMGLAQTGHARLASEVPSRASNGEATTFVFEVAASNIGSDEDLFRLEAVGAPAAWTVTLPQKLLRLDGDETQAIPVLVTTPFRHQHGARDGFVLEMRSTTDPGSVGRLELSVLYVETPQPAGHHDTLFLHGRASDSEVAPVFEAAIAGFVHESWMNSRVDDPFNDGGPHPAGLSSLGLPGGTEPTRHVWEYPLSPQLQVGLDFDLKRTGLLTARIETTAPAPAATLSGALVHLGPVGSGQEDFRGERGRAETVLANLLPATPEDMDANSARDFELQAVATPEADLVPFAADTGLVLRLEFTHERPSATTSTEAPWLAPGATLNLPLNEYHDPVDDAFASLADVALVAVGAQERLVNPAKTVVFDVALRNGAQEDHTFQLGVTGPGSEWVRLLGPDTVRVASGSEAMLRVAVSAPADAHHGDAADLILEAVTDDETLRSLVRLYALVDTQRELADESAILLDEEAKESPGPGALLLACLVAVAGAWRRRVGGA